MPKIKSHRGVAKRFKRSATGKIKRSKAFKRHILTSKPRKRKRKLATAGLTSKADSHRIGRMLLG